MGLPHLAVINGRLARKNWASATRGQLTENATLERAGITSRAKEGAERPGKAEYRQFLGYAKGSAGELQTQIIIAGELDYLPADQARRMVSECIELSKMLWGLIRSMS